jgi:hypothetical protein
MQPNQTITLILRPLSVAIVAIACAACGDDGSTDALTGLEATDDGAATTDVENDETGSDPSQGTTGADPEPSTSDGTSEDSTGEDDTSGSETGDESLEVVGTWVETYPGGGMTNHTITDESWTQTSEFGTFEYVLESYDNAEGWVVGLDEDDGTYSRFDWFWDADDELYYCTAAFFERSAEAAIEAPKPDEADLETGCGGFSWSHLQPT